MSLLQFSHSQGVEFLGKIGFGELILILVIVLIIFGPSKLPEMGRAIGNGLREFKRATKGLQDDLDDSPSQTKESN